jgi:hypothetical protein
MDDGLKSTEVDKIIEEIDQLLTLRADVDAFAERIHRLLAVAPKSLGSKYPVGTRLYRATNHHVSVPRTLLELSHPPDHFASLGRANRKGRPMFYCSSDPNCTLCEIRATVGQIAVYATWVTTEPMVLHDLGYTPEVFKRAETNRVLPNEHQTFIESLNDCERKVRDFLFSVFTEPTSGKYAFTAAIAEMHLTADWISGIKYPAVAKSGRVDNLALKPIFVSSGLKLESAHLVKIDAIEADGAISGVVVCDFLGADTDGTLHWKFREKGVSMPPGAGHVMQRGVPVIVQSSGDIQVESKKYHVEAGYTLQINEDGDFEVQDLRGNLIKPRV